MLRKLLFFAIVLAMAAGVLVACGAEEDEEEDSSAGQNESAKAGETQRTEAQPIDAVQTAYKNTTSETARVTFNMNMDMDVPGGPAGSSITGEPAAMEFSMDGKGVVDFPNEEMRMSVKMEPMGNFQMRMVDGVAYQRMPQQMRAQMGGGKPWIEMDLDSFYEQQYGMSYSEMQGGASTDPTQQLEYLRGVSGSVEQVGKEEVRGVQTTHYRAVVDLEKAFAKTGAGNTSEAYDQMVQQMGTGEVPVDVWIDEQDRVRRYRMDMEMNVPAGQPAQGGDTVGEMKVRVTTVQEYFDFGIPVEVSPPPAGKTMSMEQFEKQMQQQMPQQQQAAPAATS